MQTRLVILTLFLFFMLAGCGQANEGDTAVPTPTHTPPSESESETAVTPVAVTYFTPAQQEGPYYTIDKPADRDNDLITLDNATGPPAGQVVAFNGKLYDAIGMPIAGAVIEIWQTDINGVYHHPNDPGTGQRDRNFQFYGEAITADDGSYSFRTLLPGEYEPRPRHIHVKIKLNGQERLTTQFYFTGDLVGQADNIEPALLINLIEGSDGDGQPILSGERDIVLRVTAP